MTETMDEPDLAELDERLYDLYLLWCENNHVKGDFKDYLRWLEENYA